MLGSSALKTIKVSHTCQASRPRSSLLQRSKTIPFANRPRIQTTQRYTAKMIMMEQFSDSLATALNAAGIPCVLWGHYLWQVHGIPTFVPVCFLPVLFLLG